MDRKAWGFACCRATELHAPPCAEAPAVNPSAAPEEAGAQVTWRPRQEFETSEAFIAHTSKYLAYQWIKWLEVWGCV